MYRWFSALVVSSFLVACGPDGAGGTETHPTGLTGPELALPSGLPGTVISVNHTPQSLVADASTAFWVNRATDELFSAPRSGAADPTLVGNAAGIGTALRLDDTHVYWGAADGVYRVAKSGGTPERLAPLGFADGVFGSPLQVELFEGHLYWTAAAPFEDTGHLMRVPVGGGTAETLFTSPSPGTFALGSGRVFFVDDDSETLNAKPLSGGDATVVQTHFDSYLDLWVEVDRLFMVRPSPSNGSANVVNSLPAQGGTLRFEANVERSDAFLHDTTFFLWPDRFGRDLKAQRRDGTTARVVVEFDETLHGVFIDADGLLYFEGNELKRLGRP